MSESPEVAKTDREPKDPQSTDKQAHEKALLLEWWESLKQHKGDRAALRRAATIEVVLFNPSFHRLRRMMAKTAWTRVDRLALIAALAARVRDIRPGSSFAAQLGKPAKGADKSPLSGLRFRRLLQAREADELLQLLGRAVAVLEGELNLADLAGGIYWWGDRQRRQWAFDYYDANPQSD